MSVGVKCRISPDSNINTAIPFSIIKALSFHNNPTHNQPETPTKESRLTEVEMLKKQVAEQTEEIYRLYKRIEELNKKLKEK
jgi:hypothetical protein